MPNIFEELAIKVFTDIPQFYKSIYFACDTYKDASIKGAERENRGCSGKLLIRSSKMKIPRDFQRFLNDGKSKERLFELFEETSIQREEELRDRQIYFARDNLCQVITTTSVESLYFMNHEEADTKLISLVRHASENTGQDNARFLVRSCSGDIDIPVIMLASSLEGDIVIDNGRSNNRKMLRINQCTMNQSQRNALVGLHAFSSCDQNS